jgi:hypothetical protein
MSDQPARCHRDDYSCNNRALMRSVYQQPGDSAGPDEFSREVAAYDGGPGGAARRQYAAVQPLAGRGAALARTWAWPNAWPGSAPARPRQRRRPRRNVHEGMPVSNPFNN